MTQVITETIETVRCSHCGVLYGMPEALLSQRRRDGQLFYCPNGDSQAFVDTPAHREQKLEKERATWEAEAQRLIAENDRLRDDLIAARHPSWSRRFLAGIRKLRKGSRP